MTKSMTFFMPLTWIYKHLESSFKPLMNPKFRLVLSNIAKKNLKISEISLKKEEN